MMGRDNEAVIAPAETPFSGSTTRTILIIDDDESATRGFERILQLEGFDVARALSAEAGLQLASVVRPDAIILDLRMPVTSGLQFLRLIRATDALAHVPVAIVTGDLLLADAEGDELRALGASVRFKPLWLEDLVALARSLTDA